MGKDLDPSVNIETAATWWSRIFFSFINPLLRAGTKKPLVHEDLGTINPKDRSEFNGDRLQFFWDQELKRPVEKRSLSRALRKTVGVWNILTFVALYGLYAAASFGPVLILNALVKYFEGLLTLSSVQIWILVVLFLLIPIFGSVCTAHSTVIGQHLGVNLRAALCTIVYKKSLRLGAEARLGTSTGQIVNTMSNDTGQILRLFFFINYMVWAPAQIGVALFLVYEQVGPATFVGLAYLILISPMNAVLFAMIGKYRRANLRFSDRRVKLLNELLGGIRIIKYYAWEAPFSQLVTDVRKKELQLLKKIAYTIAIGFTIILISTPIVQPLLIFYTYARLGNQLTAAKAFTTITLFNLIKFPIAFLPVGLTQLKQSSIAARRIQNILELPELKPYVSGSSTTDQGSSTVISFTDASFSWGSSKEDTPATTSNPNPKPEHPDKMEANAKNTGLELVTVDADKDATVNVGATDTQHVTEDAVSAAKANPSVASCALSGLNVKIQKGWLVAIVGGVGTGKSSFLSAILGEMVKEAGDVEVHAQLAYCAQTPWIVNASVKDNILFGAELNEERFRTVVKACALLDDLRVLPAAELTEIGERGINLSGGQKARVSLARAAYRDDPNVTYVLDDPLSAVDAHVSAHLFSDCICGLMSGKTRLLVTHHVHFLPQCDYVIILENGTITHQGTFEQIMAQGVTLTGLVNSPRHNEEKKDDGDEAGDEGIRARIRSKSRSDAKDPKLNTGNLINIEERNVGKIGKSDYWIYFRSGNIFWWVLVVLCQALSKALDIGGSFWLAYWSTQSLKAANNDHPFSTSRNLQYLDTYAAFGVASLLMYLGRSVFVAVHRVKASKVLHERFLASILLAPTSFFDITPVGRLLNRFAADMDKIDLDLTQTLNQLLGSVAAVVGDVIGVIIATKGTFLAMFLPLSVVYAGVQKFYTKSSTEIQRLESISRSPVFADFSQTLSGVTTIRAYKHEERFITGVYARLDRNTVPFVIQQLIAAWLAVRLDIISALTGFFIAVLAVSVNNFIPASWLALAFSYSIDMTQFLKATVQQSAQAEADMNSVERVSYYTSAIEHEKPHFTDNPVDPSWPSSGRIVAKDVCLKYRDGPLVLKGVSFDIRGGEKIGIVGRTGSGKSSLMVALFRMTELAQGTIEIDGIDVSQIGLNDLRSRLSIIPQDPLMFSNTVRFNLDPFNQRTDAEIWDALEKAQLKDFVNDFPDKLSQAVAEGGENFSQGQRQLLCIARALLRRPKVIVLDEATSSIDNATDEIIQAMITRGFNDSTVLTIAHRLHTIINCDRILVLDSGRIAEFDSPSVLLQNPQGLFKSLWMQHQASHHDR